MPEIRDSLELKKNMYRSFSPLKARKKFRHAFDFSLEESLKNKIEDTEASILDAGCGNGDLLRYLLEHGHRGKLVGIDCSEGMIDDALKIRDSLTFSVGDIHNLDFSNDSFDIIILKHVVYHLDNLEQALREVYRCLKAQGILLITINSPQDLPLFEEVRNHVKQDIGVYFEKSKDFFSIEDLKKSLEHFEVFVLEESKSVIFDDVQAFIDYFLSFEKWFVVQKPHEEIAESIRTFLNDKSLKETQTRYLITAKKL